MTLEQSANKAGSKTCGGNATTDSKSDTETGRAKCVRCGIESSRESKNPSKRRFICSSCERTKNLEYIIGK